VTCSRPIRGSTSRSPPPHLHPCHELVPPVVLHHWRRRRHRCRTDRNADHVGWLTVSCSWFVGEDGHFASSKESA
jgi:hypothetical protein